VSERKNAFRDVLQLPNIRTAAIPEPRHARPLLLGASDNAPLNFKVGAGSAVPIELPRTQPDRQCDLRRNRRGIFEPLATFRPAAWSQVVAR
jgi:hypothetical protein